MWDNPRLLNAAAGFLVGLAALAFAAAATYWLLHSTLLPLRTIELRTVLKEAPRGGLEATLARVGRGNFFAAPIDELRSALERTGPSRERRTPTTRSSRARRWVGLSVTSSEKSTSSSSRRR